MAVELATAYVSLAIESKGIAKDVTQALRSGEPAAEAAGKSWGQRFSGGFGTVMKGASIAAGALASAGVAAAGYGIKVAAANEQARISFTTMLGSGKKADKFLRDLQSFAAKTPFEFPELQTAASSLISAGIEAKKVIPIMTTLGDVTSGMGTGAEGVKRATIALQQMNAAGRITGEDLNQLRDAGIPVYDLLAKATGKSKAEVVKLAQAGKLGKDELDKMMKALETGAGLERFSGLMDKQSASLTGLWSTLKDTIGQGLATAIEPAIPAIKQGLGLAIKFVGDNMPKVADGIKAVVAGAPAFVDQLTRIKDGAQGLYDIIVKGDFTGKFRTAFNLEEDSDQVARIFEIRDAVVDFIDSVRGTGEGPSLFDKVKDALVKLQPILSDFVTTLPAIEPTVQKGGELMGFLADHVDLVGKALPYVIALFAAFKAAQAANNVVGKESLIGFGLQTVSTLALAASNRQLAASMAASTAAQTGSNAASNVGLLTNIRNTAATIAQSVATKAASLATKVAAAGQWLLNAALSANPIGLVVAAIAGLIAIVVLAYKKNETFRKIVDAVWAGIKKAVLAVVDWFRNTAWPWVKDFIDRNVVAFQTLKAKVQAVWDGLKAALKAAWDWISKNVFDPIKKGVDLVKKGFGTAVDGIKTVWDNLQNIAKKPIKFIIETVLNNGLIASFNWLSGKIGGPTISKIPLPKGFASGGVLPGYTPGRDVHRFVSPTGGILDLSGGEGILVPQITKALGGAKGIAALNSGDFSVLGGRHAYAGGGIIDWIKGKAASGFNWLKDKTSAIFQALSDPLGYLRSKLPRIDTSSTIGEFSAGVKDKLLGSAVSKVKDLFRIFRNGYDQVFSGENARTVSEMMAVIKRVAPELRLSSGYRPGAITALGNVSQHAKGLAVDLVPPSMGSFQKVKNAFPNAYQLFYSPADGQTLLNGKPWFMDPVTKRNHYDHIHLSNKAFDTGGVLAPGWNMIRNDTGGPEHLVPASYGDITVQIALEDLAQLKTLEDFLAMLDRARVDQRKTARSGRVTN